MCTVDKHGIRIYTAIILVDKFDASLLPGRNSTYERREISMRVREAQLTLVGRSNSSCCAIAKLYVLVV